MDYMGFSSSITSKNTDIYLTNYAKCKDGYLIDKYNRVDLRMKVAFISMLVCNRIINFRIRFDFCMYFHSILA
jgi:hypothetical protein